MGRYYQGDIEGKFWFAVQSSADPEFFSPSHIDELSEEDCGMILWEFEKEDLQTSKKAFGNAILNLVHGARNSIRSSQVEIATTMKC